MRLLPQIDVSSAVPFLHSTALQLYEIVWLQKFLMIYIELLGTALISTSLRLTRRILTRWTLLASHHPWKQIWAYAGSSQVSAEKELKFS